MMEIKNEKRLLKQFKDMMNGKTKYSEWKNYAENCFVADKTNEEKDNYLKYYELQKNMVKESNNSGSITIFITLALSFITFLMSTISSNIGILLDHTVDGEVVSNNIEAYLRGMWDIIKAEADFFSYLLIVVLIAYFFCAVMLDLLDKAKHTRKLFYEEIVLIIKNASN